MMDVGSKAARPAGAALRALLAAALALGVAPLPPLAGEARAEGLSAAGAPATAAAGAPATAALSGRHALHGDQSVAAEYDVSTSGTVKATAYRDGCLVFSGIGIMDELGCYIEQPWWDDVEEGRVSIKRVEFGPNVAAGDLSGYFAFCQGLEEVANLPYGTSSLGDSNSVEGFGTFYGCKSLTCMCELPSTVTSMVTTFYGCTSLPEAPAVPQRVRSLDLCFAYCRALEEAPLLPAAATSMERCFEGCGKLASLPAGWAFPDRVEPDPAMFGSSTGPGGGYLATYCDPADYEALSKAIYWADAGRSLEALADYSAVAAAEEAAAGVDRSLYTDASLAALDAALAAVERPRGASAQAEVDAMAARIGAAVSGLVPRPADYSGVDAALASAPSDLSGYTRASASALAAAAAGVDRTLSILEQARVDAMAEAVRGAVAALEPLADYAALDLALASVPADLSGYTDASAGAVRAAAAAVVRGRGASEQGAVDGWAAAVRRAVGALAARRAQLVSARDASVTFGCAPFSLGATASGGGALSYEVTSGAGVVSVSGSGMVTVKAAGTATVRVSAAGTGECLPAERTVTVTVARAAQLVSARDASVTFGCAPFSLGAKASGGGALSYEVTSGAGVVSVSPAGVVTVKGAGTAVVRVSAAATAGHAPAQADVAVRVAKAAQSVSARSGASKALAGKGAGKAHKLAKARTFQLKSLLKASAKTAVTYRKVSGNGKVKVGSSGKVTVKKGLKKGAYPVKVRLAAAEGANYKAAKVKTVTFKVVVK